MEYTVTLLILMGISIILALSLNLITGYCGQISLGHAAFYGAGAYCAAMMTKAGIPFGVALLAGTALAGALGVIVGLASLRVRHDFLAITTMGVGFLFLGVVRKQDWLGGEMGIFAIPDPGLSKTAYMVLVLVLAALVAAFSLYLKRTWMGFAFDAIADDEDTARMVGIDVPRYKLTAFAMGTALAGLAGGLYAHDIKYIGPDSFSFIESITILSMVVIGGIGSVPGVIFAAAALSVLPQWLQFIAEYKLLLYGGLLFAVMRFSPGGLAGMARGMAARARAGGAP
ncbi:MAG: branched-chain amino acid ABC transporter permease [Hyphomicrobiales bacterium]|nr:branched-chain amino acid ABC transporter permease [Hyphomicrobiales bacterium]MCP5372261.1 branched-chain amino acid ABC transporter permease [Hyphomicrobiales bacterium]